VIGPSLAGSEVDHLLLAGLALATGVLLLLVARRWPLVLAVGYLAVMCFVPVWCGVNVKLYLQPQVLMGLVVLAVALPQVRRLGTRLHPVDLLVLAVVLVSVAPLATGGSSLTSVSVVTLQYLGAYGAGRLLPVLVGWDRLSRVLVTVVAVVAVLALVEYSTGTNVFVELPGSSGLRETWASIQIRGGVARAEGAFGHSIALGATLALSLPLILAAAIRPWLRLTATVLVLAAVVVTFSRIGLVSSCIGLLLCVLVARDMPRRIRAGLVGAGVAVAVVAIPLLGQVFDAAGEEAAGSAGYRSALVTLIGDIDVLGFSSAFSRGPDGAVRFGDFESIDNALLLHGLTYGWLSLGLVLLLLAIVAGAVLLRRASPATIALAAQLPALASVALITQYASMIWFVGGLAVWAQAARSRRDEQTGPEDPARLSEDLAPLPPTGERPSLTRPIAV
jgi:hypothetical protein